ncbi:unnamed protein product [Acanthoscelides obtectus]|uniref:Uncharacterized protein n=1 Tax=Acanthoscelides obtectus TaxID=200917 RepID=A0A9P0PHV6_ACAOB|nr:unnamed protein product [Acanthoscelides obtectus]CAK1641961.1 hypothetical protein AOBTE_LOCUS12759 [Acanthoscelides obtectus]
MQDHLKDEPKNFWSFIHRKNNTTGIPNNMIYNDESINDPEDFYQRCSSRL